MRRRSRSGPLGRIGRQRVCHLVSRCTPRPAVRLDCYFPVMQWFDRRAVVPLAPEAGAAPTDGILSDVGNIVAAERPGSLLRAPCTSGSACIWADWNGACTAGVGYGADSGDRRAGT